MAWYSIEVLPCKCHGHAVTRPPAVQSHFGVVDTPFRVQPFLGELVQIGLGLGFRVLSLSPSMHLGLSTRDLLGEG